MGAEDGFAVGTGVGADGMVEDEYSGGGPGEEVEEQVFDFGVVVGFYADGVCEVDFGRGGDG